MHKTHMSITCGSINQLPIENTMRNILFCFFWFFLFHSIYNLERLLYINEIFSLVGFCFFIIFILNKNSRMDRVSITISFLFLYLSAYSVYSFFFLKDSGSYEFLRTLPIVYSIPSFFLGVAFVRYGIFHTALTLLRSKIISYPLAISAAAIGGGLSNPIIFPLASSASRKRGLYITLFLITLIVIKGGSTSVVFLLFFLLVSSMQNYEIIKKLARKKTLYLSIFFFIMLAMYFFRDIYSRFLIYGWEMFSDQADTNLLWRYFYWNYVFENHIVENPLMGIGFGTALFDTADIDTWFIQATTPDDEYLPYTHSVHNSFVFMLVRGGLIGLLLLLSAIILQLKTVIKNRAYQNQLINNLFVCFVFVNIAALFNVFIETPLYASIFWIVFGILNTVVRDELAS